MRARTVALREGGVAGRVAVLAMIGSSGRLTHDASGAYAWVDSRGNIEPVAGRFETIVAELVTALQSSKDKLVAAPALRT